MLDNKLLDFIVCPQCRGDLELDSEFLICHKCQLKYPIKDDIPILLIEEAQKNNKKEEVKV